MKNKLAVLMIFYLFTSCGYTLQGGGKLPGNVKTVSVELFKNKSSQSSAEVIFANALIEELMRSSNVKVLENSVDQNYQVDRADAIISGTINSISFDALARTSVDSVYKRGVRAVVNIEMKSRSGEVLFSVNNFKESESYTVSKDNTVDEAVVNSAVDKIARSVARRFVSQMTDDF